MNCSDQDAGVVLGGSDLTMLKYTMNCPQDQIHSGYALLLVVIMVVEAVVNICILEGIHRLYMMM